MGTASGISLSGDLHVYPFGCPARSDLVARRYEHLLDENNLEEILCLTRLCSEQTLTEELATTLDVVGRPTVKTLTSLATEILRTLIPSIEILSDHERIELLAEHLSEHEWGTDYLANAAQQGSFQQDVGRLLIEMESRDALSPEIYESTALQEIAAVGQEFQTLLETNEYVDEPSLVPLATAALRTAIEEDETPDAIAEREVLVIADFEEFAQTERQFLEMIAEAADATVCALAERRSRLLSSWREAGSVEEMADGLEIIPEEDTTESPALPQTIGRYLVTGDRPETTTADGAVRVIEAPTFKQQLTLIADEIERLCRTSEYTYSDITIGYQDSSAPIERTIRLLRRHGIPTTAVTLSRLGDDPAVRELHDVITVCAESTDEETSNACRERLLEIEGATEDILTDIRDVSSAIDGLWMWIGATDLKDRIGTNWEEIETRDQFRQLRKVLELAEFLESEPRLDSTWDACHTAVERAFKYSSTRLENIETDRADGGVQVRTIYGLKHTTSKAVFLPNVTDQDYPFTPDLTALIPTSRLRTESAFPTLTTQSVRDVAETFETATETVDDPFYAYFTQVSRRLLGIGACAASDQLYFGVPRENADSLGTYHQPSRFLTELVDTFDAIEPLASDGETPIASHGGASEFVVEHVDETLEEVRRAAVGGDSVDLDAYEQELRAIETLLEKPEAATVRDAIEARIDFRHGRVRRD
ncbi:PD-(D/E)XK nuclease family protein [Haloplanus rubicundus]|uniref:ATP-dependent helicase n=1 Tax=Haloplanus rubicundus TaxID=1547898 RepID=A0A345E8B9_9EURY|nr:ATP-dependent helicase [Haloplanus rubicundus]AXG08441.1 ATP-dependent helicase [Haloplanus rubicundus]